MYRLTNGLTVVRLSDGAAVPADSENIDYQAYELWVSSGGVPDPAPLPSAQELEEIKRKLLAEAMVNRDRLLGHLERLRTRAIEANNTAARNALTTAIVSLENAFNDPRVVSAIDGEVKPVLKAINREIGQALGAASPASLQALLTLDAL